MMATNPRASPWAVLWLPRWGYLKRYFLDVNMSFQARRIIGIIATLFGLLTIARNYWRGQPNGLFPFMLLFIGVVYLLLTSFGPLDEPVKKKEE